LRQAYGYWQDQPGNLLLCLASAGTSKTPPTWPGKTS